MILNWQDIISSDVQLGNKFLNNHIANLQERKKSQQNIVKNCCWLPDKLHQNTL